MSCPGTSRGKSTPSVINVSTNRSSFVCGANCKLVAIEIIEVALNGIHGCSLVRGSSTITASKTVMEVELSPRIE